MRPRATPSRLEIHRLKFHQNGRRGPLVRYSELDAYEKELIQKELLQDVRVKRIDFTGDMDEEIFDQVYLEVLSNWGVACPHPFGSIEGGLHAPHCRACGCSVISALTQRAKIAK
jgi:hypothetical protein